MVASESFNGPRNPLSALAGRAAAPNAGGSQPTTQTEAPQAPQAEGNQADQFASKEQAASNKTPNQPSRQAASRSYRAQEKTEISVDVRALRQKALQQKAAQETTKGESQAPALPDFPPPPAGSAGSASSAASTQAPSALTQKAEPITKQAIPSDFPPPPAKQAVPSDFPPPPPKAAQASTAKSSHTERAEWNNPNKAASTAQASKVGQTATSQASSLKARFERGEIQLGEPPIGSHLLKPQSHRAYRTERDRSDQDTRRMEAKSQLREIITQRNLGLAPAKKLERQLTQLFALLA